jgi:hypothetical protein
MENRKFYPELESLRGVAALCVVVLHLILILLREAARTSASCHLLLEMAAARRRRAANPPENRGAAPYCLCIVAGEGIVANRRTFRGTAR